MSANFLHFSSQMDWWMLAMGWYDSGLVSMLLPACYSWLTNAGTNCSCHPFTVCINSNEPIVNVLPFLLVCCSDCGNELVCFRNVAAGFHTGFFTGWGKHSFSEISVDHSHFIQTTPNVTWTALGPPVFLEPGHAQKACYM